jgi:D-alanyl-D-alanine carboxypeptidase
MLTHTEYRLINGQTYDAVPARLYSAKANADARQLAQADWLIRDRESGRYVATWQQGQVRFFHRNPFPQKRLNALADLLSATESGLHQRPLSDLAPLHAELGLCSQTYSEQTGLTPIAEPVQLEYAGNDGFRRPLWLDYDTANAWVRMRHAAARDQVLLLAVSGYRSAHYQMGIFRRKLQRGLSLQEILKVNAAPGFSEHHSGRAIDIGTPGQPPAEESFEHTAAYAWLDAHAAQFGFRLSYPRGNSHGISYEPWHWYWIGHD